MTLSGVDVEKERENRTQSTTLATIDQEPLAEDTEGERTDSVDHSIEEDGAIDSKPAPSVVAALPKFEPSPPPAEIDTAAVQRAVASIQLKDAKLSQRYQEWQQTLPPDQHDIVPSAPLTAFRKKTAKARQATFNLSRSATTAHALHRLQILQPKRKHLLLHMLGVDHVETNSVGQIRATFGPLVRWLAASPISPESIEIILIGPNVVQQPIVDLLPSMQTPLKKATVTCHLGAYHELNFEKAPQLAVAFNAGIWGYDEWIPTLDKLKGTVFVVTAYTLEEAEDDVAVLEQQTLSQCVWKAEANPFGSLIGSEKRNPFRIVYIARMQLGKHGICSYLEYVATFQLNRRLPISHTQSTRQSADQRSTATVGHGAPDRTLLCPSRPV